MTEESMPEAGNPLAVLRPNRMKSADHVRVVRHAEPAHTDSAEDLLKREYWKHFAATLKGGDKIEILWEDRSRYAEGIVIEADRHGAAFAFTLGPIDLEKQETQSSNLYDIKWAGPHAKHRVVRLSDNEIMRDGFESREAAVSYVRASLKAA